MTALSRRMPCAAAEGLQRRHAAHRLHQASPFFRDGRGQREEASAEGSRRRSRRRFSRSVAVDGVVAHGGRPRAWPLNAPDIPYRPILTDAARPSTFTVQAVDEHGEVRDTPIAGEQPLTLYVDKREILTLMTLGAAPEAVSYTHLRAHET